MKSFMSLAALAASVSLASAQVTYNETTGTFTCSVANGTFCAGDSLNTNIIIRCNGFVGQPGNCDDNLDGEFPQGDSFSPCWASSPTSGIAACSKNCVVYGSSGNSGTFTLPNCVPTATPSSSITVSTSTSTYSTPTGTGVISSNSTSLSTSSATSISNSTATSIIPTSQATSIPTTISATIIPASSGTKLPLSATGGLLPWPSSNTTAIHSSGSGSHTSIGGSSSTSATATPISPPSSTISTVPTFTGAANTVKAGSALAAAAGLFVAYLL